MPLTDEQKARQKAARRAKADAKNHRVRVVRAHAGNDLAYAVQTLWPQATFTDWSGFLAEISAGVTILAPCYIPNPIPGQYGDWKKHRITMTADGFDLHDHPGHVIDEQSELLLAALGAPMSQCVAAAIYLPAHRAVPRTVSGHLKVNVRVRALHTAIAWAQHPDHEWTPEFGESHLRYGITPAMIAEWDAAGWDRAEALLFQQQFAPLEVANAWRAEGQVSLRVAKLAGRGEYPNEEQRWAAVGFTASKSAKWRKSGIPPQQAMEWERVNIAPQMVEGLLRADREGYFSLDTAKEWCSAGIPSTEVQTWHNRTNGNLATALKWHGAKVKPNDVTKFIDWNFAQPNRVLTPEVVRAYRRAYFPADPQVIADAITYAITPEAYKSAIDGMETPGNPLAAAIKTGRPAHLEAWRWPDLDRHPKHAMRYMRGGYNSEFVKFILDWLIRHRFNA